MFKVLLPGEALIDRFTNKTQNIDKVGGAPVNVACAISKLAVQADFMGTVGNDKNGQLIKSVLEKQNLATNKLFFINKDTTIANVKLTQDGERTFRFIRQADAYLKLGKSFKGLVDEYDFIHLGSATAMLGQNLWKTYKNLSNLFYKNKKIVSFDPNYRSDLFKNKKSTFIRRTLDTIKKANIVKLSKEELIIVGNTKNIKEAIIKIQKLGPQIILVTMGRKGSIIFFKKKITSVKSIRIKQIDSTGAGDAFIGYFIGLICKGEFDLNKLSIQILKIMVQKANVCAALTSTKLGGMESIPTKKEVNQKHETHFSFKDFCKFQR